MDNNTSGFFSHKNIVSMLLGIIIIGAVLRFWGLGNTSFVADEFLDINSSYAYAKTGVWQAWDFNFDRVDSQNINAARDQRAWLYKWQVAQILKNSRPTEAAARTVSAIWGIISILIMYWAAINFTKDKKIALLSAFLFAVSIAGITFDRRLRMYSMFFPVFLAFSTFTFKFLEEEYGGKVRIFKLIWKKIGVNVNFIVPMAILGLLSLHLQQLTANIVFIFVAYAITLLVIKRKTSPLRSNKYSLSLGIILIGAILMSTVLPQLFANYASGLSFFIFHPGYIEKTFYDYSHLVLALIFLLLGSAYLYKNPDLKKESVWLTASFWTVFLLAIFVWHRNAGEQYVFFVQSFQIILIASGIYATVDFFGKNLAQYGRKAFLIPLALTLLILPDWRYFTLADNTYNQTSVGESANYKKIFAYFKKNTESGDVLISRNFRNYYWFGAKIKTYDFGGEVSHDKLTLDELKAITAENARGWLIVSDNDEDYISNDVLPFAEKNFEKINNPQVRGKISVYRWITQ